MNLLPPDHIPTSERVEPFRPTPAHPPLSLTAKLVIVFLLLAGLGSCVDSGQDTSTPDSSYSDFVPAYTPGPGEPTDDACANFVAMAAQIYADTGETLYAGVTRDDCPTYGLTN